MTDFEFKNIDRIGDLLVHGFHPIGLFTIGAVIIWAAVNEPIIIGHGGPGIKDILLLICLGPGAWPVSPSSGFAPAPTALAAKRRAEPTRCRHE